MLQTFCLKWNAHTNNMMDAFKNLLLTEEMVDVTLFCDGRSIKAHKIVLSTCSPLLQSLFLENPCQHPIVILKDIKYEQLKAIVEFIYYGEVNIPEDQLSAFIETAQALNIKGLAEFPEGKNRANSPGESTRDAVPKTDAASDQKINRISNESLCGHFNGENTEPSENPVDSPEILNMYAATSNHSPVQPAASFSTLSFYSKNSFDKQFQQQQVIQDTSEIFSPTEHFNVGTLKLIEKTSNKDDLHRPTDGPCIQSSMTSLETHKQSCAMINNTDHYLDPCDSTNYYLGAVQTFISPDPSELASELPKSSPDTRLDSTVEPLRKSDNLTQWEESPVQSSISRNDIQSRASSSIDSGILAPHSVPSDVSVAPAHLFDDSTNMKSEPSETVLPISHTEKSTHPNSTISSREQSSMYVLSTPDDSVDSSPLLYERSQQQYDIFDLETSEACGVNSSSDLAKDKGGGRNCCESKRVTCSYCTYSTSNSGYLKSHLRIHTGEKPYACSVCNKKFNQKTNLKTHVRIHTGEKPFVCEFCNRRFAQQGNLRTHLRSHTREKHMFA